LVAAAFTATRGLATTAIFFAGTSRRGALAGLAALGGALPLGAAAKNGQDDRSHRKHRPDAAKKKCKPEKCPTGCCSGKKCLPGTAVDACGTGGAACVACAAGKLCVGGACRVPVQGACTSAGDCVPGQGLACGAITGCDLSGDRCCAATGRACGADCDCCGTDLCRAGQCEPPATSASCDWAGPSVACGAGCCNIVNPYCCIDGSVAGCCGKGYPNCCPPIPEVPQFPEGYCCALGFSCCPSGCCSTSGQNPAEVVSISGVPRSMAPARGLD